MDFLLYPLLEGYFPLLDSLLSLVAIIAEDGIYRELCTQEWNSSFMNSDYPAFYLNTYSHLIRPSPTTAISQEKLYHDVD
jgi:hypothetical protein